MDHLKFRLMISVAILTCCVAGGIYGLMHLEGFSFFDSLYFVLISLSTVGYGDVTPATTGGKILVMILIIAGVATFMSVVANTADWMINLRKKRDRMKKLHIIIGLFFSEAGTELLRCFAMIDVAHERIVDKLDHWLSEWSDEHLKKVKKYFAHHAFNVRPSVSHLIEIRDLLYSQSQLFLRLLENPILLEKEEFTDLQWSLLHLKEEFEHRRNFENFTDDDIEHLSEDIKRAYKMLFSYWFSYMEYLHENYPFLFKLAIRRNPFHYSANLNSEAINKQGVEQS